MSNSELARMSVLTVSGIKQARRNLITFRLDGAPLVKYTKGNKGAMPTYSINYKLLDPAKHIGTCSDPISEYRDTRKPYNGHKDTYRDTRKPIHNKITENNNDVVVDSLPEIKENTAASRIDMDIIKQMSERYDAEIIQKVITAMEYMDGEVENADAYFTRCVSKGWIPTSKKMKAVRKAHERKKLLEKERHVYEQKRDEMEREMEEIVSMDATKESLDDTAKEQLRAEAVKAVEADGFHQQSMGFETLIAVKERQLLRDGWHVE